MGTIEAETAGQKVAAEKRAEAEEKRRTTAMEKGDAARAAIATYDALGQIAGSEQASLITGIFERPEFVRNLLRLAESSVGIPGATIGIPEIRTIATNLRLPIEFINQSQFAASLMAQIQLQISRLAQGQGAVSDFERNLFGQAGITIRDNPQTILAKLDMLKAEAEFSQKVAGGLADFRGSIDQYKKTNDYQTFVKEYKNSVNEIFKNRLAGTPAITPLPKTTPAKGNQPSGNRSNERVIDGNIWNRQPDGSWKDSGRKAP